MTEFNYDEVTHSVYALEFDEELCRFETRFPERLSRLSVGDVDYYHLSRPGDKSKRNKNSARYRTQPITFDEIAEVDEDLINSSVKKNESSFPVEEARAVEEEEAEKREDATRESQIHHHQGSDKENNPLSTFDDLGRQRRRRQSFRKLRNRHSVPEEITEKSEDAEGAGT